jgi:glycerol-3-phosphate dehydrogenase
LGIARELGVPLIRCGGLYLAFKPEGIETIKQKQERALQNGAGDLSIISGDQARELEPRLSGKVIAALVAPTTSVISPFALLFATAQNAYSNGVRFRFDSGVQKIERSKKGDSYLLHITDGTTVRTRFVLNLAGDDAALLDAQVHPADLIIRPKLGQYLVFDKQGKDGVGHVLFQAGEDGEGGTLLAPTTDGNLLVGPTSQAVRSYRNSATTTAGLEHVKGVALKLVPDLDLGQVITAFGGVRTNISNMEKEKKDFVLRISAPGFVSALGIKNPGMTCAPALAKQAVELLRQQGLELTRCSAFEPWQEQFIPFMKQPADRQKVLLKSDPAYSTVICRCEQITQGDVRAVLAAPLPPKTQDGLKRRLRTGMGRCQGAFCSPRAVALLAEHQGIKPQEVQKGEQGGHLVARCVK